MTPPTATATGAISPPSEGAAVGPRQIVAAYVNLTKPRIIELLLITTVPAMFLAAGGIPPLGLVAVTMVGGYLAAGSANTFNNVLDRDIDVAMRRTRTRALPRHRVGPRAATVFAVVLGSPPRSRWGSARTGSRPVWRWRPTPSTCSSTRWCSSDARRRTSSGVASRAASRR